MSFASKLLDGLFGGSKPTKIPTPSPAAPISVQPKKEKSTGDLMEKLRRARSRALSFESGIGMLKSEPNIAQNSLSDTLG